ncbi:hypothetical protein VIBNIENn2_1010001 [Vibrio nigripulchritudo ENn2]|nr:hypothetical protein VIBNIENn2_1010001 [Vibrio nigripulchritudo ENn2]
MQQNCHIKLIRSNIKKDSAIIWLLMLYPQLEWLISLLNTKYDFNQITSKQIETLLNS